MTSTPTSSIHEQIDLADAETVKYVVTRPTEDVEPIHATFDAHEAEHVALDAGSYDPTTPVRIIARIKNNQSGDERHKIVWESNPTMNIYTPDSLGEWGAFRTTDLDQRLHMKADRVEIDYPNLDRDKARHRFYRNGDMIAYVVVGRMGLTQKVALVPTLLDESALRDYARNFGLDV